MIHHKPGRPKNWHTSVDNHFHLCSCSFLTQTQIMAPPLTLLSPHHSSWKLLLTRLPLLELEIFSDGVLDTNTSLHPPWSFCLTFKGWQWCPSDILSGRSLMWHVETWKALFEGRLNAQVKGVIHKKLNIKFWIVVRCGWRGPKRQILKVFGFWFRPQGFQLYHTLLLFELWSFKNIFFVKNPF